MGDLLNSLTLLAALTAPPDASVMTLSRFPSPEVCQESLAFNGQVEACLLARQAATPRYWWEVQEALNDCHRAHRAWWWLRYAWGASSNEYRQACLNSLHEEIGDEAYYTGTMPCPIPLWFTYGE